MTANPTPFARLQGHCFHIKAKRNPNYHPHVSFLPHNTKSCPLRKHPSAQQQYTHSQRLYRNSTFPLHRPKPPRLPRPQHPKPILARPQRTSQNRLPYRHGPHPTLQIPCSATLAVPAPSQTRYPHAQAHKSAINNCTHGVQPLGVPTGQAPRTPPIAVSPQIALIANPQYRNLSGQLARPSLLQIHPTPAPPPPPPFTHVGHSAHLECCRAPARDVQIPHLGVNLLKVAHPALRVKQGAGQPHMFQL